LAEARAAFRNADPLRAEHERLKQKMRPLEKKERELERRIDNLEDDDRDASHLREQLRPIARQLRQLEAEEERLDDRKDELNEAAETKLREIVERAIRRGVAKPLN
jgi:chromosome segregation ATPase